ncbi:MAG TPA: hypothetical protein DD407_09225 [Pseudohongiella sp.]|nr:hypothetical protein [Pseudohongiella sp.]
MPMTKAGSPLSDTIKPPLWVNAEITYKCPLHCVFCYNPLNYASTFEKELTTEQWLKALREARELGAVQLGISGGEPLMRDDCEEIVAEASKMGYYVNLLTSGIGLTEERIAAFKAGGLDQIQLSFQDSTKEMNDFLSSTRTFDLKRKVARLIKQYDYPMVLNVVLHRLNIDHIEQILQMAEEMEAEVDRQQRDGHRGEEFQHRGGQEGQAQHAHGALAKGMADRLDLGAASGAAE